MNIENATILKFQNLLADSKADWEHIIYSNFYVKMQNVTFWLT